MNKSLHKFVCAGFIFLFDYTNGVGGDALALAFYLKIKNKVMDVHFS